ncbi:MAG: lipopolysaccharide biosynthesis protein [Bacteroides sp.]|nr:lipopolysaccharide biosynthesis protein [Bacteroides sp.]MCM1413261.1 lipopolysaccharide biosynthesis protein [Bacteroides sp.]MCM1471429.1 lipopolysaccharide biosynthesis protein [Bacteroides sp.]
MEYQENKPKSRSKKFIKDLGIYAIGNLGAKFITFLLVPLYTHCIHNTSNYGYYELAVTVAFCFIPILSFQMNDGGFRFLIENKNFYRQRAIISFILPTIFYNSLILTAICGVISIFHPIPFLPYILAYGIIQTFYEVITQLIRGLGHTKLFVAGGITNSLLTALFSLFFLLGLHMDIDGIMLAAICARTATILAICIKGRIFKSYLRPRFQKKALSKALLKYSLPLIPVALGWWLIGANNRFFIEHYLGLTDTGYYGIVCQFTGILYILCFIFYQTWQQNAIEQYNSPGRDAFFSSIFNNYLYVLLILVAVFPYALRINYFWLVGQAYQPSGQYLFLNSVFVMISAIANFFDIGYQCAKRTARILPSLFAMVLINIGFNFLLVKPLGINGIIISSIIAFTFLAVYRAIDTRKFFKITPDSSVIFPFITFIAAFIFYYFPFTFLSDSIAVCVICIIAIITLPKSIKTTISNKIKLVRQK